MIVNKIKIKNVKHEKNQLSQIYLLYTYTEK